MTKRFCNAACSLMWTVLCVAVVYLCVLGVALGARASTEKASGDASEHTVSSLRAQTMEASGPKIAKTRYLETVILETERADDVHPYEKENADAEPQLVLLDTFIATAYCDTGYTASGAWTQKNHTLSVNPNIIPLGTHVWIYLDDGTLVGDYWAEDTGSNMYKHPYVIDIYMGEDSYDECVLWGAQHVSVYVEE